MSSSYQQSMIYSNQPNFAVDHLDNSSLLFNRRTISENSNNYSTPPTYTAGDNKTSNLLAGDNKSDQVKVITKISNKRKQSDSIGSREVSHHFKVPPITLTQQQFSARLCSTLTDEVLKKDLQYTFPSLSDFRTKFIIPWSRMKNEGETEILNDEDTSPKNPIALKVDVKDVLTAAEIVTFSADYKKIFLDGCHVKRKVRGKGLPIIPDTEGRAMLRDFLGVLWKKLGKT